MGISLSEVKEKLQALPPEKRAELVDLAMRKTKHMVWVPNPGPQTEARNSPADELFYGGQAGGGKSDLEIGLALTDHQRSLLLRRTNREANGLVERITEILGTRDGFNGQSWKINGKIIDIGGCQLEEDKQKFKGSPHDLICFDEVSDFTESQYTFIIGWNRSANKNQRCRVVAAGNPPTQPEGLWVLKRWAAWLDPTHPDPAQPGELRWYTTTSSGKEIEVDGRGPHRIEGEELYARSRTFIPASLSDNLDLAETNYSAVLAALPAAIRSAYRDGRFDLALKDDELQVIPATWVRAAQNRYTPRPPPGVPMCAIGVDVAQGGSDKTVLAIRYDGWYEIHEVEGVLTPDGVSVAAHALKHRRDGAKVIIDLGGGYGGAAYEHLRDNGIDTIPYKGAKASTRRTSDNQLGFYNTRSEAYWRFREALDPSQHNGSPIMLPTHPGMLADLTAPRFTVGPRGIKVEAKEDVVKRLGRSTDYGDAIVMAWWAGPKANTDLRTWESGHGRTPVVVKRRPK